MKKKLLLLCTIAILSLTALAGCGNDKDEATDANAEENMVSQAIVNSQNVKSVTYDMTMDMAMDVTVGEENQALDMTTTGSIEYLNDPMSMSMNMNMDMGEAGAMDSASYGEIVDGNFVLYTSVEDQWLKQTVGTAEEMEQYNSAKAMEVYLESMKDFTEDGVEDVNGSKATKFTGTISGDDLQEVMDNMAGMSEQMATLGLEDESLASLYADSGDLTISIWIDNQTVLPVKYEMDMTTMMQNIMEKLSTTTEDLGDITYNVSNVFVSMTVTGYDNVEAIDIPEEARNAQELSELAGTEATDEEGTDTAQ